jgi:GTP-binding protein Era
MSEQQAFRVGKVALVGRSNVGKSTLVNALVKQKVAIVSHKPQTTRSQIIAVAEDIRGQIFFLDTPGFYAPFHGGNQQFNSIIARSIEEADVILYVVDHTRDWGQEEEKIWNLVKAAEKPIILIINKNDVREPSYLENYLSMLEKHVTATLRLSAKQETHLSTLIDLLFDTLPEGKRDETVDFFPSPLLSQDSKEFIAELVREKIYALTGQEVPYRTSVRIQSIENYEDTNTIRILGVILVDDEHYKPILIGKQGRKIGEIRSAVRKELEIATNKTVHISLRVEVDR